MEEELEAAVRDAGVSRAQLGTDGVSFSVDDEEITLLLGDAEEHVSSSVEDAVVRIQAHAEESEADPTVTGAITDLADWLRDLVEDEEDVAVAARDLGREIEGEAKRLGLIAHDKLHYQGPAGHAVEVGPEGDELAFFEDPNGLFWALYARRGGRVAYRELSVDD
ncbi:MAG: hypothetical protein DRJ42_30690 [Deltaproteobacteria bacterium]|nr:MAG: hypothetical protein DRJ42_30690 [Deltaproteobacteria bacterium]